MILRGSVVTGLFRYQKEVTYTAGDLILDNSTLYVVLKEFYSSNKELQEFVSTDGKKPVDYYTHYHEYNKLGNKTGLETLVTAGNIDAIISERVRGLSSGEIETITINGLVGRTASEGLNSYLDTGIYRIKVTRDPSDDEMILNSGEYILKCYSVKDGDQDICIQEIIGITQGFHAIRSVSIKVDGRGVRSLLTDNTGKPARDEFMMMSGSGTINLVNEIYKKSTEIATKVSSINRSYRTIVELQDSIPVSIGDMATVFIYRSEGEDQSNLQTRQYSVDLVVPDENLSDVYEIGSQLSVSVKFEEDPSNSTGKLMTLTLNNGLNDRVGRISNKIHLCRIRS